MKLQTFCPRWGNAHVPIPEFIEMVKSAGYDGVEMTVNISEEDKCTWRELLSVNKLLFIGQMVEAGEGKDFVAQMMETELYLKNLATLNPVKINTFTGRDYYTFEQNCQLIERTLEIEAEIGIPIVHEIHRGRFAYSIAAIEPYLEKYPQLRLNADLSHWCCVSESYLQQPEQLSLLRNAFNRFDHIHARVGYPQGPQVNDPRAPEWAEALTYHLGWWKEIAGIHQEKGSSVFTMTPEFGPIPYLPSKPYSNEPLADQWEVNVWMMKTLREEFSEWVQNI